jgi:hypothetical protein
MSFEEMLKDGIKRAKERLPNLRLEAKLRESSKPALVQKVAELKAEKFSLLNDEIPLLEEDIKEIEMLSLQIGLLEKTTALE